MTEEQKEHMFKNSREFHKAYCPKYEAGQLKHSGDMWEMGAYQALENMEQEVLDQWSYARQIRKTLDEITEITRKYEHEGEYAYRLSQEIGKILNRVKED